MKKVLTIFVILIWIISGCTGVTYHWLYCMNFDVTVNDIPVLIFTGSIIGPFVWVMVAWNKLVPDDLIIIKNKGKKNGI